MNTPVAPRDWGNSTITPSRLYFLDWLRILALAALVVYHVGMYYVSWDFHVKARSQDRAWCHG